MLGRIGIELRQHAPFTAFGAFTGIAIMVVVTYARVPASLSRDLFWGLHPLHVLLSAIATTSMFRLHSGGGPLVTFAIGYVGSIGIATLSDCLIPFLGEWLLAMPNRGLHLGFIEKWWLVNPLAAVGIAIGLVRPRTRLPHAGHVLLSTWASLFHMTLAIGDRLSALQAAFVGLFLFLAVWVPCCTSDIVFPLLLARTGGPGRGPGGQALISRTRASRRPGRLPTRRPASSRSRSNSSFWPRLPPSQETARAPRRSVSSAER